MSEISSGGNIEWTAWSLFVAPATLRMSVLSLFSTKEPRTKPSAYVPIELCSLLGGNVLGHSFGAIYSSSGCLGRSTLSRSSSRSIMSLPVSVSAEKYAGLSAHHDPDACSWRTRQDIVKVPFLFGGRVRHQNPWTGQLYSVGFLGLGVLTTATKYILK